MAVVFGDYKININDILTVLSILTIAVSSAIYVWQDKKKIKQQEFENYFTLIKELTAPSGHWGEKVFLNT
ncbi:MAG: hypothetical protein PHC64_08180 [Candidatus Gastranaerophilales bacterium]|nr:hypothetical protein [Candidatus Gastranaerophilales bacterium]